MKKVSTIAVALTAFCAITARAAETDTAIVAPQLVVMQPTAALPAATPDSTASASKAAPAQKSGKSAKKPAPKSVSKPAPKSKPKKAPAPK
jgi:hypothetical protein